MKISKNQVAVVAKVIVFLAIVFSLFLTFTYLFRDASRSKREIVVDYYNEPENSLDVVFIGASNVIRYWDPMLAWNEYGFASRNHATSEMSAGTYLAAIKDALRTQTPDLLVVETRLFGRKYNDPTKVTAARHFLDTVDYDLSRLRGVKYYCDSIGVSWKDSIPLYIDLIYYHNNYESLITGKNWKLADNRLESTFDGIYKGYAHYGKVNSFDDPRENLNVKLAELDETAKKYLVDIIEYCQRNNIPLQLVATPVVITKKEARYNLAIAEIADSYGVPFLDSNLLYDEIGIDFETDFYDAHHTNVLGADKFTAYLAAYLKENYELADHRGDPNYASWDEIYQFYKKDSDAARASVQSKIVSREKLKKDEAVIRQTQEPLEWCALIGHSDLTLLMLSGKATENKPSSETAFLMKGLGIKESYYDTGFMIVYQNQSVAFSKTNRGSHSGTVGSQKLEYSMDLSPEKSIIIDGTEYLEGLGDGIHAVVYNNNNNEVIDQVVFTVEQDGSLSMKHVPVSSNQ